MISMSPPRRLYTCSNLRESWRNPSLKTTTSQRSNSHLRSESSYPFNHSYSEDARAYRQVGIKAQRPTREHVLPRDLARPGLLLTLPQCFALYVSGRHFVSFLLLEKSIGFQHWFAPPPTQWTIPCGSVSYLSSATLNESLYFALLLYLQVLGRSLNWQLLTGEIPWACLFLSQPIVAPWIPDHWGHSTTSCVWLAGTAGSALVLRLHTLYMSTLWSQNSSKDRHVINIRGCWLINCWHSAHEQSIIFCGFKFWL